MYIYEILPDMYIWNNCNSCPSQSRLWNKSIDDTKMVVFSVLHIFQELFYNNYFIYL